VEEIKLHI